MAELPKRKPTRMKGFDYSQNRAYFITICTEGRKKLLCDIVGQGLESARLFQTSFHDHIIRGEKDYRKIYEYIDSNPSIWKEDCFYKETL